MIFSSPRFLGFLAALLTLLWAPWWTTTQRKRVLLVASCLFYAAWDVRYLGLLGAISVIDYAVANRIAATEEEPKRRAWLLVSVASNLGLLGYFKYNNFFLDNANVALKVFGLSLPAAKILLPAGISFYTFKTMSYTIDVYRRSLKPEKSVIDYATFVTFFPELIAGPIVRGSVFLPQMSRDIRPSVDRLALGASIFLVGLTKKLLIADPMSKVADPIFASPGLYSGASIWIGVIAYTIQIYCDFSGYSDMAIGTAKMFGYDLPENFHMPYLATSVTDFWRRWHITLSQWLRDYLYIPLGGNREGRGRTYVNLFITMTLGGLWHGASWNFVLWGVLHGAALALHKLYLERFGDDRGKGPLPDLVSAPLTLLFAMMCWIPFRAPSFAATKTIVARMWTLPADGALYFPWPPMIQALVMVAFGHVIGVLLDRVRERGFDGGALLGALGARVEANAISGPYLRFRVTTVAGACLITAWILAIFFFAPTSTSPFIYFQF